MDPDRMGTRIGSVTSGLAADSRTLDRLKRAARDDPREAAKKVATQFEALFMQMVLKSMREATPHSGLFDSQEQDLYRGMLDQQVAQQIAAKGTGLSDLIARQLMRNLPAAAQALTPGPSPAAAGRGRTSSHLRRMGEALGVGASNSSPLPLAAEGPGVRVSADIQRDFMQHHRADALRAQQLTGVPAGFILAQAALESGWGRREIRAPDGAPSHNLFGIKAGSDWHGRTVQVTTTEYAGQGSELPRQVTETFRAYDSYAAAFQDWALTIGRNQRYSAAVASGDNAGAFALGMQQGGYSTDPGYAEKLARVIRKVSSIRGTG